MFAEGTLQEYVRSNELLRYVESNFLAIANKSKDFENIMGLVAYPNPEALNCPLSNLMQKKNRWDLSILVNRSILGIFDL